MSMYPPEYDFFDLVPGHDHPETASLDEFVDLLKRHGIDRAVFTGRQTVGDGEVTCGVTNDYVAGCVQRYPDWLVGFTGIDCEADIVTATVEMTRAVEQLGLSGVSLDPCDFPDLTIVCSHAAWPNPRDFVALAYRRPNVYVEGSISQFFSGAEPFIAAAEDLVREKMLYASAFPFDSLDAVERFHDLPLSTDALEAICWENPARVLGLDE